MNKNKGENNVDVAMRQLRVLQGMFYRYDLTDNDLFSYTNEIIKTMEMASQEIRTNYEDVSRHLTDLMNGNVKHKTQEQIKKEEETGEDFDPYELD